MIDVLLYLLGILIVLVGIAVSIGLHEVGHLLPAKLFGVKVTQFMVGFGKTVWSKRKGETEYGVKALPLGGYVAMIGMYPPKQPGEVARESTTGFLNSVVEERPDAIRPAAQKRGIGGMVEEARLASAETIAVGEDERAFYRLPAWKKIVIMLGGPAMNLVLAFVFFGILLMGIGVPEANTTAARVDQCLIAATSDATECSPSDPLAPGAEAGLLPGDRITAIDGEPLTGWDQLRETVRVSPGTQLKFTVERGTETLALSITPVATQRYVHDEANQVVNGEDGQPLIETVGMVGVVPGSENVRQSPLEVPGFVGENVSQMVGVIVNLPQRMVGIWNAAFGSAERDINSPVSMVGVGRIAGEIVSAEAAPVVAKVQTMVSLLGSLNVALFVFNLIPLMPLDGGHIAGAIYEKLKRSWARLRGKADPGPIDTAKMVPVTFGVVIVLGAMSLLLMYADIVKPISLFG